jgi:hypothetical protein
VSDVVAIEEVFDQETYQQRPFRKFVELTPMGQRFA